MRHLIKFKYNLRDQESKELGIFHMPETESEYSRRARRYCALTGDKGIYSNYLKRERIYGIHVSPRMNALSFWDAVHRAVME